MENKKDLTPQNAFYILEKYLKNTNKSKYEHSIRVAKTCKILARKWNYPIKDALIAGLLHDIGKCMTKLEMLHLYSKKELPIYDF